MQISSLLTPFLLASAMQAQPPADTPHSLDKTIYATRLTEPVVVDGVLSEQVWQNGAGFSNFTQRDPNEGKPPTQKTIVRVAYDDAAIYIGACMYDSAPDSIVARLGRRDDWPEADKFVFFIDPYFDRRSGFYFALNAGGTLADGILYNDEWDDDSWDGVWEGKTIINKEGWCAEMRIPYSQLRFHKTDQYVWGVNFRRDISRKNERDYVVFTPKNGSGFVSRFLELTGIEKITPPRRVEILPYITSKAQYTDHLPGDPFNDGSRYNFDLGADFKLGLSNNITLDATVNPDFGQVEVDPAVVNLSDVETFFSEKRPFFIEGASIFEFGYGGARNYWGFNWPGPDFFYSRRVGRAPQGDLPANDHADAPLGTHILGAAKISGKIGNSWNVGTLHALTKREYAKLSLGGKQFNTEVEPLTYYGVYRGQKEIAEGRQGLGFISTLTMRQFDDGRLRDAINSNAFSGGIDGWTFLDKNKTWVISGWTGLTSVHGSQQRMIDLQRNSQHYFQRPDASHVGVDSSATSLTGYAVRFWLNKQKGNTFFNSAFGIISPKFDVNDIGFLSRTDVINMHVGGGYQWVKPGKVVRNAELGGALFRNYDFGKNVTSTGLFHFGYVQFLNYYSIDWNFAYNPQTTNNRRTRGGPLTLNPPGYQVGVSLESDSRKTWVFELNSFLYDSDGEVSQEIGTSVQWKPAANLSLEVSPDLSYNTENSQWVGVFADPLATSTFGNRYVFGELDQTTLSASVRLSWTFTPRLSLQLYMQPLISSGDYRSFKELARPKSYDFNRYGEDGSTLTFVDGTYTADPDGSGPASPIVFSDPNFNFKSVRGNAVLRWEYAPGSTFYLVWTQNRADYENTGEFQFNRSLGRLWDAKGDNIFLVKWTYWHNL